jgi:hypothetical protein
MLDNKFSLSEMYWLLNLIFHEIENNSALLPSLNWISQALGIFSYYHSWADDMTRSSVPLTIGVIDIYFKSSDTPLQL